MFESLPNRDAQSNTYQPPGTGQCQIEGLRLTWLEQVSSATGLSDDVVFEVGIALMNRARGEYEYEWMLPFSGHL